MASEAPPAREQQRAIGWTLYIDAPGKSAGGAPHPVAMSAALGNQRFRKTGWCGYKCAYVGGEPLCVFVFFFFVFLASRKVYRNKCAQCFNGIIDQIIIIDMY